MGALASRTLELVSRSLASSAKDTNLAERQLLIKLVLLKTECYEKVSRSKRQRKKCSSARRQRKMQRRLRKRTLGREISSQQLKLVTRLALKKITMGKLLLLLHSIR